MQGYILATALVALPLTLAVTQRGRGLAELTERERLFRRNFTESMTGMVLLVLRGDRLEIVDANDTALQLLDDGHTPVVGRYLDRVLTGRPRCAASPATCGPASSTAGAGSSRSPTARAASVKVALSPLSSGPEPTFSAQLLDVSAEYAALARSAAAERLTSATLDTTNCIIIVTDMTGTVVRVNRATTTLTGFPEHAILGRPVWEAIVPAYRVPIVAGDVRRARRVRDPRHPRGQRRSPRPATTLRVVWNNDLVRDEDGIPRYAVMTGVDVTAERTTAGLMTNLFQAGDLHRDHRHRQPRPDHPVQLRRPGAAGVDGRAGQRPRFTDLLEPEELAERTGRPGAGWSALTALVGEGRESQLTDWTWRTATGGRRTVAMTLSGGGSQFGPQAGYLVVGRDVTEQRHTPGDADGRAGEGADGGRPAAPARHRQERVRLDGQPRAAYPGDQHRRLRRAAGRRLTGAGRPAASCRCSTPSPATAHRLISLCNDLLTLAGLDSERPRLEPLRRSTSGELVDHGRGLDAPAGARPGPDDRPSPCPRSRCSCSATRSSSSGCCSTCSPTP